MSDKYFTFRQFTVSHDRCAMKVGTDGVLLGAWAPGGARILDVGTGSGLIAMMMAQRFVGSHVDALEIDAAAVLQASENVKASVFSGRIDIIPSSLQDYAARFKVGSAPYDCIVSNPPFYTEDTFCPAEARNAARHTSALTYGELFECASHLLSPGGTFSIIVPAAAREEIMYRSCLAGMFVKDICYVRTTPRKAPKRMMLTFTGERPAETVTAEHCLMNPDGSRSLWYSELTSDFYL